MDDEYADAFEELLDAQEEAHGERITVKIGGNPVDAIIENQIIDPVHLMGGDGDSGGFTARCPVARFIKGSPKPGTSIEAEGYAQGLVIISCKPINRATYEITAGDPVAIDNDR